MLLDTPNLRVHAFCEPFEGYCGDFIGLYRPSPRIILGVVADACGHGAEAAALLEAAAEPNDDLLASSMSPAQLLENFGSRATEAGQLVDGNFITAMVFTLDVQSGVLTVALAGHPPPVLVQQGKCVTGPWPAGLPIGVDSTIGAEDVTIHLAPGDAFVAFTDGVADARRPEGLTLGFDGAPAMLALAALSADPVASALRSLGFGRRRDWQVDDTTALFIRYGGDDDALQPVMDPA